jgi:hypothetical protein
MDRLEQLRVMKSILWDEDREGLRAAGCPADEYDQEASLIAGQITALSAKQSTPLTVEQIAAAVAKVWNKQFGPLTAEGLEQRRPVFLAVANRISVQS